MLFSRITVAAVESCIAVVNMNYSGNLIGEWQARANAQPTMLNDAGTRWRSRIIVADSRGPGARRSASGRRGPYACWHAFRDVFAEVFRVYPDAKISTSMATYTAGNWEDTYPATGTRNVGSMMEPRTMPQLCDCTDAGPAPAGAVVLRKPRPGQPTTEYILAVIAGDVVPGTDECSACGRRMTEESGYGQYCNWRCMELYMAQLPHTFLNRGMPVPAGR
jgi:hypothetical protein